MTPSNSNFSFLFLLGILTLTGVPLTVNSKEESGYWQQQNKEQKLKLTNLAGIAGITAWGLAFWDYGDGKPSYRSEGWFGENTSYGGADKLGHAYASYGLSRGLSSLYESWGYEAKSAARYGALSSFGLLSYMELGDAFGEQGFSPEDVLFNALGAFGGYQLERHPALANKLDFRVEYVPRFSQGDIITDYDSMKFLLAVKMDGFESVTQPWLQYLEWHTGYYTRGYSRSGVGKERNLYMGIGINLSRIMGQLGHTKTATLFNYYQLPATYLEVKRDLNQ